MQVRLYTSTFTETVSLPVLERLMTKRVRKVLWIVDPPSVHCGSQVQQWLQECRRLASWP